MKRLYEVAAYGPQGDCYWATTVSPTVWPRLDRDIEVDVAVIGGGFTGLGAACHLSRKGMDVCVFEAEHAGYGASGRNGGFCCLGGAKASKASLRRRFGTEGLAAWHRTEKAAIATVGALVSQAGMQVDRHSEGETLLAHTPRAFRAMQANAAEAARDYDVTPEIVPPEALRQHGLGGRFHGAVTLPLGFALNPRKFHTGLAAAATDAGARLFAQSPVLSLKKAGRWRLRTPGGTVSAEKVILATNGYSAEDLPDWLRGRYLPVQSHVLVTEPIPKDLQQAQGWTSAQMAYDSRTLLHYFRLMPDGRFLFGMRGGLRATPRAEARLSRRIRAHFAAMFPEWRNVKIAHEWSGLLCLTPGLTPFVGPVPGHDGLFAGFGYHGNGVAMGTHAGRILADLVAGGPPETEYPAVMQAPPPRFPLGRFRRLLLAPAYLAADALDL